MCDGLCSHVGSVSFSPPFFFFVVVVVSMRPHPPKGNEEAHLLTKGAQAGEWAACAVLKFLAFTFIIYFSLFFSLKKKKQKTCVLAGVAQ